MELLAFVRDKYQKFCSKNQIPSILQTTSVNDYFATYEWVYPHCSAYQFSVLKRYYRFCIRYAIKNNEIEGLRWFIVSKEVYNQYKPNFINMDHFIHYNGEVNVYNWHGLPYYIVEMLKMILTPIHIDKSNFHDYFTSMCKSFRSMIPNNILNLINGNLKYNCLDVDSEGKITYIPYEKVKLVKNYQYSKSKLRQVTTIGKILNYVDPENKFISKFEIEKISNTFSGLKALSTLTLEVWDGDKIKDAYLISNYAKPDLNMTSTLHNSCMRHKKCQPYMEFYKAAGAKIAVLLDKDQKIAARALLWKVESDLWFLDRIYAISPYIETILPNLVKKEYKINHYKIGSQFYSVRTNKPLKKSITGSYCIFNENLKTYSGKFPYLDTFSCYLKSQGLLLMDGVNFYSLKSTNGHRN